MPLETGTTINDLTPSNPPGSDPAGQGDDHIRLIKTCVQGTFPQMGSVLGQVRRQDTALSISSIWNTNHFVCSASVTTTVVLTLPPAASITSGFYVDITTIGTGTVSLLPSGAASINGGVSLSVPRLNTARAYFLGGTAWLADVVPTGHGAVSVFNNIAIDGTLTVSGATVLGNVTIIGATTLSGAVTMKSTMSISGATTLGGTLTVSGASVLAAVTATTGFFSGALSSASTLTISGNAVMNTITLGGGQIAFPAAQNPSAGANTLDDYEEGTWTPVLSFTTPGDLSVAYTNQVGVYTKIGRVVHLTFDVTTSSFTFTTSSGAAVLTGAPFTGAAAVPVDVGSMTYGLVTAASVTTIVPYKIASTTTVGFFIAGPTVGSALMSSSHLTSGTNRILAGSLTHRV